MFDKEVEEIRERRKKLIIDKYNGDIDKMINEAMEWEKENLDRVVSFKMKSSMTR